MFGSAQCVGGKQTLYFGREWIETGHSRTGTKYCTYWTRCVLRQDKGLNDFVGSALVAQDCEEGQISLGGVLHDYEARGVLYGWMVLILTSGMQRLKYRT